MNAAEDPAELPTACREGAEWAQAEQRYFTGRMHASVARAGASADSSARLAHYDLAGRYSVAALAAGRGTAGRRCPQ